eukprot:CAMPEP_0184860522 /NCGR_PEP_ID=MMETSP0580-20130426/5399_1 /TAXON_ID=1118495 /ORGANISM="Dactyliosolen fragilissimus" /LENGTH=1323 /DNA_ID=CAMNT_0027357659 /DNA_START=148 /DNA_END=4119 /DNA_ORIENTATION=+
MMVSSSSSESQRMQQKLQQQQRQQQQQQQQQQQLQQQQQQLQQQQQQQNVNSTNNTYAQRQQATSYATNVARSMTIDEMRQLHRGALAEAEAKETELRLVLASRYRDLVGSSDEVQFMRDRAMELDASIKDLPGLMEALLSRAEKKKVEYQGEDEVKNADAGKSIIGDKSVNKDRNMINRKLHDYPRTIHLSLDGGDVHGAAINLISLFTLIASHTQIFPLANILAANNNHSPKFNPDKARDTNTSIKSINLDPLIQTRMKMVYLHVQTLPERTAKLSKRILLFKSSFECGPKITAGALSALHLLDVSRHHHHDKQSKSATSTIDNCATKLIDLYYDAKATLIHDLLNQLDVDGNSLMSNAGVRTKESDTNGNSKHKSHSSIPGTTEDHNKSQHTDAAERILSKIIRILQYDIILHPYQIFILRRCTNNDNQLPKSYDEDSIMSGLPSSFDATTLKLKVSKFLAAHLPLIRTKVQGLLMAIAGTTASRLGHMRQSLYDKTDGIDSVKELNNSNSAICTWDEAVHTLVNLKIVMHGLDESSSTNHLTNNINTHGSSHHNNNENGFSNNTTNNNNNNNMILPTSSSTTHTGGRKFSLWSTLFSHTFSSLVHSLLTASFHSVHSRVVATLRASLANAPPLTSILPHEAYRNTLRITTELDKALRKVSDDAHELLVHAEERAESERRLRQSLYVQTCEIMGRLLNELRRMLCRNEVSRTDSDSPYYDDSVNNDDHNNDDEGEDIEVDATRDLIVGRLCHLLKFRLASLPSLLNHNSSPAVLGSVTSGGAGKAGMITIVELSSSFDIADDNDDGLISLEEAMEVVEGAFSGTNFRGAEMVQETMLLSSNTTADGRVLVQSNTVVSSTASGKTIPQNVTLSELALLTARGLRHEASGWLSALGTVQRCLDNIIHLCFERWAKGALFPAYRSLKNGCSRFMNTATTVPDAEWKRLHHLIREESEDIVLQREIGNELDEIEEEKEDGKTATLNHALNDKLPPIGTVSPHILSYFLSITSILNYSVCPSDSIPPIPSEAYAQKMGIDTMPSSGIMGLGMTCLLRGYLLKESLIIMANVMHREIIGSMPADKNASLVTGEGDENTNDGGVKHDMQENTKISKSSPTSIVQLKMDVDFAILCFFQRNKFGFEAYSLVECGSNEEKSSASEFVESSKHKLDKISEDLLVEIQSERVTRGKHINDALVKAIEDKHKAVLTSCHLSLSSIFGMDGTLSSPLSSSSVQGQYNASTEGYIASSSESSTAMMLTPLASSRRFALLPIQAERSVSELQLLGKIGKENIDKEEIGMADRASAAASAVSTGFGFFSSMLGKKS